MTVRELIAKLQKMDQDALVVMSSDADGNGYSPLRIADEDQYHAENSVSGVLWEADYHEDDVPHVDCCVLFPAN